MSLVCCDWRWCWMRGRLWGQVLSTRWNKRRGEKETVLGKRQTATRQTTKPTSQREDSWPMRERQGSWRAVANGNPLPTRFLLSLFSSFFFRFILLFFSWYLSIFEPTEGLKKFFFLARSLQTFYPFLLPLLLCPQRSLWNDGGSVVVARDTTLAAKRVQQTRAKLGSREIS